MQTNTAAMTTSEFAETMTEKFTENSVESSAENAPGNSLKNLAEDSTENTAKDATTVQLSLFTKICLGYLGLGTLLLLQIAPPKDWHSFVFGWFFAFLNFELLKRMTRLFSVSGRLFLLFFTKILLWGVVIAFLLAFHGINAIPFVLGTLTILAGAVGLAMKEMIYARA